MLLFCIEIAHSKMKVIDNIVELQNELFEVRKEGKSIGLVPTMGALHEGHASLVRRSVKENDITVVSVFLNPTQFNDKGDLERYPRTLDHDCTLMDECGADIVFAPSVKEMYPTPDTRKFEFPPVTTVMEGATPSRTLQRCMPSCFTPLLYRQPRPCVLRRKRLAADSCGERTCPLHRSISQDC